MFILKTKFRVLLLIGLFLFRCSLCSDAEFDDSNTVADDNLMFAHLLCRHGDRNVVKEIIYPDDIWAAEHFWNGGYGELTKLGKQQQFDNGEYFRKRYANLIGNDGYSPDKIYIQSTDVDRVLMSAEACLAGLFPPHGNQNWNKNLGWEPIPVHTLPLTKDYLLAVMKPCDRFNYLMTQFEETAEYKDLFERNQTLIQYLEENSGKPLHTISEMRQLQDTLLLEQDRGFCLPTWAEIALEPGNDFEYLAFKRFEIFTAKPEMKKLRSGYLLKEILDRFKSKAQSTLSPNRSVWMYFAHEFQLGDMLNSLGLYWPHAPPVSSCILFELYQNETEPYVQIFYKNSTDLDIPAMNIPNCGTKCSLSAMYELYEDILPTQNYEEACELLEGEVLPPEGNPEEFEA